MTLKSDIENIHQRQLEVSEGIKRNFALMQNILYKEYKWDSFSYLVQYNPERIRSSDAKTDKESISKRPCFLCKDNRPTEQLAYDYLGRYEFLVNPYPIFPFHMTIVSRKHERQLIEGHINHMLSIAKQLDGYFLLYNGERCGASAPDHFHFQLAEAKYLPILKEAQNLGNFSPLCSGSSYSIAISNYKAYKRSVILIKGKKIADVENSFSTAYKALMNLKKDDDNEPMFNLVSSLVDGQIYLFIILRAKHKPSHYFLSDDKKIITSPGTVDLAGVFIAPRLEDYKRLTKKTLINIIKEVSLQEVDFAKAVRAICKETR
ncbi:MAG: DUF4922 domain-containing protein [Bacteroidales bacterium]